VGDTFRIVFNEQIQEGDTLTVNAVHFYLGQNAEGEPAPGVALGEAIIGQSVCGVTASGAGQPGGDTTTTTTGQSGGSGQVTTTTAAGQSGGSGQVTTTTAAGSGSTATTVAPSQPAPTTPAQPRFTG
jgi:pyruvate/2-oxoglutarate dehydrogenase complex dihydrolipoamide acyltransferase (E2) component